MVVCSKGCKFWPNRWFFVLFQEIRNFFLKSSSKCKDMAACSKSCQALTKSMIFRALSRNEAFFVTFSWKVRRNAKIWYFVWKVAKFWPNRLFFKETTMFWCFDEFFSKKWLNSWKSAKDQRFRQNFATFRGNYHVLAFWWIFQQKVAQRSSSRVKTRKTIDLAKTSNFWSKVLFLAFLWTFQQKVAKSASFGEKAREIIDLAKIIQLFEQTTMFLDFD